MRDTKEADSDEKRTRASRRKGKPESGYVSEKTISIFSKKRKDRRI